MQYPTDFSHFLSTQTRTKSAGNEDSHRSCYEFAKALFAVRFSPIPGPDLCRLVGIMAISDDLGIVAPVQLQLSAQDKLNLLRQVDRWRKWQSLDDRRLCLGCGHLITGHEIDAIQTSAGIPELHCPTQGCQSIPLDWILPNPRDGELQP